ncbi:hypothetical protein PR048_000090 [Dryococelus australis]|uniref:MHC class I antigen n=1 Tax=Dryococelus australis TaxID=614101 RepID=A0ABQ9IDN2_9NEOP|nr:hypothetical protein PR048_000090 [Dryococelus australis]
MEEDFIQIKKFPNEQYVISAGSRDCDVLCISDVGSGAVFQFLASTDHTWEQTLELTRAAENAAKIAESKAEKEKRVRKSRWDD